MRQPPTQFRSRLYFKNKNQSKDEVLKKSVKNKRRICIWATCFTA